MIPALPKFPAFPAQRLLGAVRRRLRSPLWKPDLDAEIAAELAFHAEMLARDNAARGLSPADSAAAVRGRLGDLEAVHAACRSAGRSRDRAQRFATLAAELLHDLRLAARRLNQRRGAALFSGLVLALGLAGAGAAWQLQGAVDRARLGGVADDLVLWRQIGAGAAAYAATPSAFAAWRRQCHPCAGLAAFELVEGNLAPSPEADGQGERVTIGRATASLLPLLGARPWSGRGFTPGEMAARGGDHRVAVLSHGLWLRLGAPAVEPPMPGRWLWLDGVAIQVIGVLPRGFDLAAAGVDVDLWLPLAGGRMAGSERGDHHRLQVVARLRDGGGLTALAPMGRGEPWPRAPVRQRQRARFLVLAAVLLWLLASLGAASQQGSRTTARQRESDVHALVGGGRRRLLRQWLAESLMISLAAALVAFALAGAAARLLAPAVWGGTALGAASGAGPSLAGDGTGGSAVGVVLLLAALSWAGCALVAALQALRPELQEASRQAPRLTTPRQRRASELLLVGQLAASTALLAVAALLLVSIQRLERADPGYDVDHAVSLSFSLDGRAYPPAARRAFVRQLEERLCRLSGVASAGVESTAPLAEQAVVEPFEAADAPLAATAARATAPAAAVPVAASLAPAAAVPVTVSSAPAVAAPVVVASALEPPSAAEWRVVTPGAFAALRLRLLAGRLLNAGDTDGHQPAAVVDAALARRLWPRADPLGRRLRWAPGRPALTVVGVVDDQRDHDLEALPPGTAFLPYAVAPWRCVALVVRPRPGVAVGNLASAVRREIAAIDPRLPVSSPRWLSAARAAAVAAPHRLSWLLAAYAAAALALAASGLYAAAAAAVARRTAEIALRQALGAAAGAIVRLVVGRGAVLALLGAGLGLALVALARPLYVQILFASTAGAVTGAATPNAGAYLGAAAIAAGSAFLALAWPACRAARIPPGAALRRD